MNWLQEYEAKRTTAEQAVKIVRSGDTIYIHPGCANPEVLVKALLGRARELRNVEVVHLLTFGNADYSKPQYEESFRGNALFIGGNVRGAIHAGRADYTPIFLHEIEELFTSGQKPLDVVLLP